MPARSSRQSTSRAAAQSDAEDGAYNIPNLNYNEPLSWRAGKAISIADLLARLQNLSTELRNVEQGTIEGKDIAPLAQDLVHSNLLGHKDKGIRAWTVSCVVDILNICAPNAPYRDGQLKDIFKVIFSTILPALADPSNAYNAQHQQILDTLVDTQSIVLVADVSEPEELLCQLFSVCFDVVSGTAKNTSGVELAQSVVFQIGVLLNTVVEEANLPQEVVDIIISQFLRVDPRSAQPLQTKKKGADKKDKSQSTLLLKDYPPAYHLAKNVCTTCSEKMSASISQYFSTIITNASSALDDDKDKIRSFKTGASPGEDSDDDDHEALDDLRKAHRLVKELWRACPDVLMNVVPQLEVELAADSIALRQLAVETLGDLVAGVGLAGLPDLPVLDPSVYPPPSIDDATEPEFSDNPLLKPSSPKPFIQIHPNTYTAFMGRRIDKAMPVRKAWAAAAARILLTNAGGIGLSKDELSLLMASYAKLLKDVDEKVRTTALEGLEVFPYTSVVRTLGSDGGLSDPESVLATIAERVTDRRIAVREKAMFLLGSMWGVAVGDIGVNNQQVTAILGQAPTRLLSAMFAKDAHVAMTIPKVLYECLLPLSWPPARSKGQVVQSRDDEPSDPDAQRAKRLLTLMRNLDDKAKLILFGMQKRQADMSKAISQFLVACEEYNGGIMDDSEEESRLEARLKRFIDSLAKQFPESPRASSDLWKFAKAHDRRNYQLIKFAIGAENDYKTMVKAIKELSKRLKEGGAGTAAMLDTLMPILYQCALISYNRSHIPAIMELARSSDAGLAEAAQEILREISEKVPEVMKTHIQVLCRELQEAAPAEGSSEPNTAVDALKACALFARKFPSDVPHDRKFVTALQHFALYSSAPKAAKYATNIILTTSDKKDLRAKELLSRAIKRFRAGSDNRLAQLATIASVCLYSPEAAEAEKEQILKISVIDTLKENGHPQTTDYDEGAWAAEIDDETCAKLLALKVLVNRCRAGSDNQTSAQNLAQSVTDVLVKIIQDEGEFSMNRDTPSTQRNHLRLGAARSLIKLCRYKRQVEDLVKPQMFQEIAWMLLSRPHDVRKGLVTAIKKYLLTNKLNIRWITPLFLLAFEPDDELRNPTIAWLKSRNAYYSNQQKLAHSGNEKKVPVQNVMETSFARLLSLLAHHPDYPTKSDPKYDYDLLDFARNIVFYLQSCATEDNLSLIFHIAQRTKQAADAVSNSADVDGHLYVLSDLAQATIRNYADQLPGSTKGVNLLQTWPGKAQLPSSLFKPINGHDKAQKIAAKNYLPEDVAAELETIVRKSLKRSKPGNKAKTPAKADKKRKSSVSVDVDENDTGAQNEGRSTKKAKKSKTTSLPIRKTPTSKKRKSEHGYEHGTASRKSARSGTAKKVNYEESEDDENGEDAEDIVKYKPATIQNYKHKSGPGKASTPEADEEGDDVEEDVAETGSPTPQQREADLQAPEDQDDGDMADDQHVSDTDDVPATNGHHEEAENDNEEDEAMTDDADEAKEPEATPSPPTRKRASRGKATTTVPAEAKQVSKVKTPVQADGKSKAKGSKVVVTEELTKQKSSNAPVSSSPAAEPSRRSSRRGKT